MTNAPEFLQQAADLLIQRGKQYDQQQGERSMARTIHAFNVITGNKLTEKEGWLIMELLKNVRLFTNPDKFHEDSAKDGIAYSALKTEAFAREEVNRILKNPSSKPLDTPVDSE